MDRVKPGACKILGYCVTYKYKLCIIIIVGSSPIFYIFTTFGVNFESCKAGRFLQKSILSRTFLGLVFSLGK